MKRSEMVDTINNILEECIDDKLLEEVLEWSEAIMKEVELQGMLPPTYDKPISKKLQRIRTDSFSKKGFERISEWEPEDE